MKLKLFFDALKELCNFPMELIVYRDKQKAPLFNEGDFVRREKRAKKDHL